MKKSAKVLNPQVGILVSPVPDEGIHLERRLPNECCEEWEDVEVMPFWDMTAQVDASLEARQLPNFCPMCGTKLTHTE